MSKNQIGPEVEGAAENFTTEIFAAPPPAPKKSAILLMYVGPPVRDPIPLGRGTVFNEGLPGLLKKRAAEDADFAALFLPLKAAGAALRDLERGRGELVKNVKAVAARAAGRK